ncbi:NAD(P)-dependent oxidoreductase [Arthrobacter bambusae]|uniref:3-hydroxyisobutyrate dehydrogenase-like beta-hydroxyacid dehydrogenase n=1 Tax=Arthrobacter bambusae TaxID=1338426 RepID=A0AAW8DLQ0_9MICC|nr:NAD(P)-dependent oxidoreductase [Arthrobacter bambusae]MDP9907276.1 3-hydroxyisobutyrate dehydrogenase-like beta-hydroxyacid dehydrogenase [Arthrobacter bambusae]MDQ0131412.1 3-hydroxyisobutyrate dehydrogenase-like beta-hydroxyacid dehydrogenase [Arthrobacter bambusae]MDQ0182746.1 3-hydroxyisobutyrate dehydrogenase-like beta-hydroxyacid dehydrogenase [Arthrobacter bambusae]
MNVSFIGVGAIGLPMAKRLIPHFNVTVFDPAADRVKELTELGATSAESASKAAAASETVIVMVATPAQLEQAVFGPDGAADGFKIGATAIIMSSVGVDSVTSVAERLKGQHVQVVDAPVTGGVVRAVTGELTILTSGDEKDIEKVRPVLQHLGTNLAHSGDRVGDGQAVKLVNQLLCSVHLAVAGEALNFAKLLGLDPEAVLKTVGAGAASSFMLNDRGPRMLSTEEPPVLSAIDIFVKDSTLVKEAASRVGADVPLLDEANARFQAVSAAGFGRVDDSAVIRAFEA